MQAFVQLLEDIEAKNEASEGTVRRTGVAARTSEAVVSKKKV